MKRRVLLIDEDAAFRRFASHVLGGAGHEVIEATSGRAGLNELAQWTPDCVILDVELSDLPGLDVLRAVEAGVEPRPPVVIVSANLDVKSAVSVMKHGAKDAVDKPVDARHLRGVIDQAIERSDLARSVAQIEAASPAGLGPLGLATETPAMQAVVDRIDRLASVEMPVLIVGERGSGADELARRIHAKGPRAARPFVEVPALDNPRAVDSALFGSDGRPSAFAQAQDGTIFITNLVSLSEGGQERLARVLGDLRDARASGQPVSCPRVVVASERDLPSEVALGRVREDLAHRLAPLTVQVPALRDRRRDIPELVARIVDLVSGDFGRGGLAVGEDVLRYLAEQPWPGNLDELHAVVVRGVVLARDGRMRIEDVVGPRADRSGGVDAGWRPALDGTGEVRRFDDYEAEIFRFALERAGGCVSRAAETLGVGRATMYRKMRSYDIDAPPVSERAIVRSGRKRKKGKPSVVPGGRAA